MVVVYPEVRWSGRILLCPSLLITSRVGLRVRDRLGCFNEYQSDYMRTFPWREDGEVSS